MSRTRKQAPADPLDARIARIRAVWALMGATTPESRETFLAKLDEIGRAWTGYCWLPEYDPASLTAEGAGPLLDPACRAGNCPCPGAPCEHSCHTKGPSQ